MNAEVEESIANTVHGFEDFPISDDAVLLVEGGSARAAFHDLTIHEEGRRIEPIRNQGGWLSHDLPGREWGAGPQEGCGGRSGKKPSGLAGFNGRILRKPEHVGLTSHSARAAPRRVLRSGRSETMGLPGETESCRRSERARRTRRPAEAIRCRGPASRGATTGTGGFNLRARSRDHHRPRGAPPPDGEGTPARGRGLHGTGPEGGRRPGPRKPAGRGDRRRRRSPLGEPRRPRCGPRIPHERRRIATDPRSHETDRG